MMGVLNKALEIQVRGRVMVSGLLLILHVLLFRILLLAFIKYIWSPPAQIRLRPGCTGAGADHPMRWGRGWLGSRHCTPYTIFISQKWIRGANSNCFICFPRKNLAEMQNNCKIWRNVWPAISSCNVQGVNSKIDWGRGLLWAYFVPSLGVT